MDNQDDPERRGGFSPPRKAVAAIAIVIFLFGGGWAALSLSGGADPRQCVDVELPAARNILGMLALDRDVDDYEEYADLKNAGGDYYRDQARIAREMRPLRARYEASFSAACAALRGEGGFGQADEGSKIEARLGGTGAASPYVAKPSEVYLPPRSDLPYAHPYALDCFFLKVDRNGEAERGPSIRALYPGLVVAAEGGWSGSAGIGTWKGGGLSPAAGNGVVVYDPESRRYVSYFHLSSVSVRKGDIVKAGAVLGRGGNTGMNARKPGHGEHVHIEIFDCRRDDSLSSSELLDLLRR